MVKGVAAMTPVGIPKMVPVAALNVSPVFPKVTNGAIE
jgi:hypothetical protein